MNVVEEGESIVRRYRKDSPPLGTEWLFLSECSEE